MTQAAAPQGRRTRATPLFVQVLALIVLSLLGAQVVNLAILYILPPPAPEFFRMSELVSAFQHPQTPLQARNGRTLTVQLTRTLEPIHNVRRIPVGDLYARELAARMGLQRDQVRLALIDATRTPGRRSVRNLRAQFGPGRDMHSDFFVVAPFEADVKRPDGQWLMIREAGGGLFVLWWQRTLLWFAVSALALIPVAYLFARRLAAPIAAFGAAAERLGRDPGAPPIPHGGPAAPAELEAAALAFNEMQDRLRRYVHDRTAMIGAIAHDLRTPLTRLRFRVESAPSALAAKMSYDIDEMERMIAATMAFVRDATHQGARERLEFASLVDTIANEMSDIGRDVSADTLPPVVVYGDPMALRRLVTNLLDNALKFGERARARVYVEGDEAILEVDDDGPGVPEHQREIVFEPFERGERSRSRETGGAGLGLAVVRTIARAHGGDAALENLPEGGLRARTRLPLSLSAG